MKKVSTLVLSMVLIMSILVACGNKDGAKEPSATTDPNTTETVVGEPKPGGKVTYGIIQPFKGLLDRGLYEGEDDDFILNFSTEGFIKDGDDLKPYPNLAEWTVSDDHLVYTFKIKQGVKWHNGDELTAEDWKFAIEVLADKDYTGVRYSSVEPIKGVQEYHDGKADSISGIKIIDPYTMEMTLKAPKVNAISNIWRYPMPKKYYEGIAVKDLASHDKVRKNPIGVGPFKVVKVQPGEYVELARFDDYWQGKPLLDGVVVKVIDGKMAASLLKNGEIDIMKVQEASYKDIKDLPNIKVEVKDTLAYSYIGFKLGKHDPEKAINVMNNPKFQNKKLRQAMAHAIDRQGIIDAFSNGLGTVVNSPMANASWAKAPEDQLNKYEYDPEKAKKILDEAGYKDVDGDGMREDPQGKKFTINYDAMTGTDVDEPKAQAILQMWNEVGLDAKLNGGSLKEFNLFYEAAQKDDPTMEVYAGAWGLDMDPDPTEVWSNNAFWNMMRWVHPDNDKLLNEALSLEAFDENYRKEKYIEWQKLTNEELPMIVLASRSLVTASNNRLQDIHINARINQVDTHKWWVTDGK